MERLLVSGIASLPEVVALVVTDHVGALLEARGKLDGEAVGAVHAFAVQSLAQCGDALGLGGLHRVTVTGSNYGCVIAIDDRNLVGLYVDPSQPLGAFEHKLEMALGR